MPSRFMRRMRATNFSHARAGQILFRRHRDLPAVGLRKDYCAWTWGDALFVILDNYWHSPAQVDSGFREQEAGGGKGGRGQRDWWALTLGDAQYQWFKRTLETSKAKYKFVFAHHVMGSGRGGVDECDLYEWGGYGHNACLRIQTASSELGTCPCINSWSKHGVTIFFQGHDHLYCQQERDGIIYQEVPMPADQGYVAYNEDRYQSGVETAEFRPFASHRLAGKCKGGIRPQFFAEG